MELSFSLNYLMKTSRQKQLRGIESAAAFCRDAGFRRVDYDPDFRADDWEDGARRDREILDKAGIAVIQTHAPFNRYKTFDDDMFPIYVRRLVESSKILGAKNVVFHADEYRTVDRYDEKEILEFTYDYLAPYVELAQKLGLTVAVENLFDDEKWPYIDGKSRFTSRIGELKAVIERFDSPTVKCCWDFGHAKCAFGGDMASALCEVGKYVVCTHVHDNYYGKDLHLVPFLGEIDWKENLAVLKAAGYAGDLSFEFVYGEIPDALVPSWMKHVYQTGEKLVDMFKNS